MDNNMELYLRVGAVTSAMYVYLNGSEVGYSQDSKLPAEFNVTQYANPSFDGVCVRVLVRVRVCVCARA